jgi:hypothetical protein
MMIAFSNTHLYFSTGNIMQTICIGCGRVIEDGEPEKYASSGACKNCLARQIKTIQRRQGNFDCFGSATDSCDQFNCKYRWHCFEKTAAGNLDKE